MILVDSNILLYAYNSNFGAHSAALTWWEQQLHGSDSVGLSWQVIYAFLRVGTNVRLFPNPLTTEEATRHIQRWFDQPCVQVLSPTQRHWEIFQTMLTEGKATANLVSDAHLAAIAVEHGCLLCSTDRDFARFPGLKWCDPLGK